MVSVNLDIAKEGMMNWKTHQKKNIYISTLKIEEKKRHTHKKKSQKKQNPKITYKILGHGCQVSAGGSRQ